MKNDKAANSPFSRRNFLQTSLLAAAGLALTGCGNQNSSSSDTGTSNADSSTNTASGKKTTTKKIGLQLYSIPFILQKDFKGTLKTIADIGYKELEFAGPYIFSADVTKNGWKNYAPSMGFTDSGYYGNTPEQLKKLLDDAGLSAPSAHVALSDLRHALEGTIEAAHTVGHQFIICPFLDHSERKSLDDYKKLAQEFNKIGETCKKAGIQFGYHNHSFEFGKMDGQLPYDVLLDNTDADFVKMELDLFWATISGADPLHYFEKYPHRFPLCHFKDLATKMTLSDPLTSLDKSSSADSAKNAMADLGHGVIDFKAIIAKADEAGLEHFIVERDLSKDPLTTMKEGYKYLSAALS